MASDNEQQTTEQFSNEILKEVFKDLHQLIVDNINTSSVIDRLFSARVIGTSDLHDLDLVTHRLDKCRRLLIILYKANNPRSFIEFRRAISDETTYEWLVSDIDEKYKHLAAAESQVTRDLSELTVTPDVENVDVAGLKQVIVDLKNENGKLKDELERLTLDRSTYEKTIDDLTTELRRVEKSQYVIGEPLPVICETPVDEFKVTVLTKPLDEDKDIIGVALANNELFVGRRQARRISVYDSKTLYLRRTIAIPGDNRDYLIGLAACSFNKFLFVADVASSIYCVHKIDLSTNSTNSISNFKVAGSCSLSITSKHNILVVFNTSTAGKVQEYSPTGKVLRAITDNNTLFHAVETKEETVFVTRCSDPIHGIVEFSWQGQILRCFGYKAGSGADQMNAPRYLAVTSVGIILVTDYLNDRIQILDAAWKTTGTLKIVERLNSPFALCYDESRGRLYVGEGGGENRLVVIDHVTNSNLSAGYLV